MNKIKVLKKDDHFTVTTTEKIAKGENILKLQGAVSNIADKYSIQIAEKQHLYPFSDRPDDETSLFRFLNHSCSPNSYFNMPQGTLVALHDIAANEEITFHYCSTEYEMASPFQCQCGSTGCLSEIRGYKYLSEKDKKNISHLLAPHLKTPENTHS